MREEINKYKIFTRRELILVGLKSFLFSTILGRYFYLQLIKSDKYNTLSDKNRLKFLITPAERGKILDYTSKEIATTSYKYRLTLSPLEIKSLTQLRPKIEKILGRPLSCSEDDLRRRLLKRNKNEALVLEENLSWAELIKISERNHLLPEISIIETPVRIYVEGEAAAHVTGYLGLPTEDEFEDLNLPCFKDFKIGKSGVEKYFDASLRGEPGAKKVEINVHGQFVREVSKKEAKRGEDLHTTIDLSLQSFIHKIFQEKTITGAAVVLDIRSGKVLALYSSPTFDPNQFADGISKDYWRTIINHPNHPLTNNAISTPYPPGSTFKLITALAALAIGFDPYKKIFCSGQFNLGGHTFRCWKESGHGYLDLPNAIAQSCNTYFYTAGQVAGIVKISEIARKMGYGQKLGIELPFEHIGLVPDPNWKSTIRHMSWFKGDTINVSIGQGDLLVTPIQLVTLASRIATGKQIVPSLLSRQERSFPQLDIPEEHLALVRKGMELVVNDPNGTANHHNLKDHNIIFAGKTGTGQVAALKFKDRAFRFKHHALFTSFAPVIDPSYAVSVIVNHGEGGAKSAAPLAKQIYLQLFSKKPDLDIDLDSNQDEDEDLLDKQT